MTINSDIKLYTPVMSCKSSKRFFYRSLLSSVKLSHLIIHQYCKHWDWQYKSLYISWTWVTFGKQHAFKYTFLLKRTCRDIILPSFSRQVKSSKYKFSLRKTDKLNHTVSNVRYKKHLGYRTISLWFSTNLSENFSLRSESLLLSDARLRRVLTKLIKFRVHLF